MVEVEEVGLDEEEEGSSCEESGMKAEVLLKGR